MKLKDRLILQIFIANPLLIWGGISNNPWVWVPLLLIGGGLLGNVSKHIQDGDI